MEKEFHGALLDALTEAIVRKSVVTVKNAENSSIIVVTATEDEIIVSLSKIPSIMNDVITAVSDCLGKNPDMVYNRSSVLKDDFIIYYMVWLNNNDGAKLFVEKEFSAPQNRITYLSQKALIFLQGIN
ncbi:MAG: hypothetical protein APF77_21370 [Clostridia bacterium BRH_c25]|nr:MAG: hypothetical protein APF77_21370 [Clostridia bacterium BRH_c25]